MGDVQATQESRETFRSNGEWEIDGRIERFVPSGGTYASKTQCRHTYVQMNCLSVHLGGVSLVLSTVRMESVASSLVITNAKGQVTIVVSGGISLSATIL